MDEADDPEDDEESEEEDWSAAEQRATREAVAVFDVSEPESFPEVAPSLFVAALWAGDVDEVVERLSFR